MKQFALADRTMRSLSSGAYSRDPLASPGARCTGSGTRGMCSRRRVVICPSGCFLTGLSSLISDFPKNISVPTYPKSHLELSPSTPQRGVSRSSRTRGWMRWTRQRFARDGIAGRVGERPVSDQQHADERCCSVRRSRVVLTPRRWRQVRGV